MSTGGADRLSLLPDDILDSILSFVPDTEKKARTSLLSKRFRHLWLHHPSICLGSTPEVVDYRDPNSPGVVSQYVRSVDACLSSLRSPLLRALDLRLYSAVPDSKRSVARLIRLAADRSVRSLRLFSDDRLAQLPSAIYSCQTLTHLHLHCNARNLPRSASAALLPSLVVLDLTCCFSDQALHLLLCKCPNLRDLYLDNCVFLQALDLSSNTLSQVEIVGCRQLKSVRLDAPNLVSPAFRGGSVRVFRVSNARHLVDASVLTDSPQEMPALVEAMRHVSRKLEVSDWLFGVLLPESPDPVFRNLKELHCRIGRLTAPILGSLVCVLGHCPNLQKLDVTFGREEYTLGNKPILDNFSLSEEESGLCLKRLKQMKFVINGLIKELTNERQGEIWHQSEGMQGLEHVRRSLKVVVLRKFLGTANETKMVEYLLGKESALEALTIDDSLMRDERKIVKLLAHMPRASPHV